MMDFCGRAGLAETAWLEILGDSEKLGLGNLTIGEKRLGPSEKILPLRQFGLPGPEIQDLWL
jgi:hypothetical protein